MKNNKFEFVCKPQSMYIIAEQSNISTHIDVVLYVNNKPAVFSSYMIGQYSQAHVNDKIRSFCDALISFTEDEIQDWANEDKIMLTLNAHRSLKKAMTKGGGTVWSRP